MKNKLIFAFFSFLIIEYILRSFVKQHKYHEVGFIMELLPFLIASILISFFSRKIIYEQNFRLVYLKLSFASIIGFLSAKAILFFQWYWIIAPEYRNVKGDLQEGLAWTLFESLFGVFEIILLFFISVVAINALQKNK